MNSWKRGVGRAILAGVVLLGLVWLVVVFVLVPVDHMMRFWIK